MKVNAIPLAQTSLAPPTVPPTAPHTVPPAPVAPPVAADRTVTAFLDTWNEAPKASLDEVLPRVEKELRRMAASFLSGDGDGVTLEATELVHELYLRLLERRRVSWQDRSHFFGFAARTMRRILVDRARARRCAKRGGGEAPVPLHDALDQGHERDPDLLALDLALDELEELSPRQHQIVEWHVFAGLTFDQIAELLELSNATVRRDWATARAWLKVHMT